MGRIVIGALSAALVAFVVLDAQEKTAVRPTDATDRMLVSNEHALWEAIVNSHVTWLDKDSAVLLYVWTGTGTFQNQPLASTTLASTVWTRRNGKWLAVHHQETDLTK